MTLKDDNLFIYGGINYNNNDSKILNDCYSINLSDVFNNKYVSWKQVNINFGFITEFSMINYNNELKYCIYVVFFLLILYIIFICI